MVAGNAKRMRPQPAGKDYRGGLDHGRVMEWGGDSPIPPFGYPTVAPPGTVEKLLVFYVRSKRREPLFHGWDARYEGCPFPYYFGLLPAGDRAEIVERRRGYHTVAPISSIHKPRRPG